MNAPSPSTRALLQAVLGAEPIPLQSIQAWQAATDIERLEVGQYQLLPLIYQRLQQVAEDHPWLPRLKGIYRRTWFANQLAIKAAGDALRVLAGAGLPALLIGPAALALTVYADPATRPIAAPQVLAPTADRLAAIRALTEAGWQPSPQTTALAAPRFARWQSGHLLIKPLASKEVSQVRLCWHGLPQAPSPAWSAQWFDRSAPLESQALAAHTLDPTDQLLQALTTGPALELIPLVDGLRLIARYPIDWPRLVRMAGQSHLSLRLGERLEAIQEMGAISLPSQPLAELKQAGSANDAHEVWRLEQIDPWERTTWQRIRLSYAGFRQQAAAQGVRPHPGNFYDYLRTQLAADSFSAMLKRGLGRMTTPLPRPHGF